VGATLAEASKGRVSVGDRWLTDSVAAIREAASEAAALQAGSVASLAGLRAVASQVAVAAASRVVDREEAVAAMAADTGKQTKSQKLNGRQNTLPAVVFLCAYAC
jgi:hypothetical protein